MAGSPSLKAPARRLIESAEAVYGSAASIGDVAIKVRLDKLDADPRALAEAIVSSEFREPPAQATRAAGVAPLAMHHADPFDRLLIAQALAEPLKRLTADDTTLLPYSDVVVRV